ncbi:MAG: metallophosphoesterase [Candidatus Hadarchaeota archaeon]
MTAVPVYGHPALMVKTGGTRTLVVSDLHLGIEGEFAARGVSLPSQAPRVKARLVELIGKKKPDRLIMLGDVKHNIPVASWQEWRELPRLFEDLLKLLPVDIVAGNHDGDIRGMLPEGVTVHEPSGIVIGKKKMVGLMHGHAWPSPELMKAELIVMGHNHPAVEFRDELGGRIVEPVWVRMKLKKERLPKKLKIAVGKRPPELLLVPAFGELVGGAPVNRKMPTELIGPIFKAGAAVLDAGEIYLLDGTFLGTVKASRKFLSTTSRA